jgi:pimeloyl-ACP methyl ester carboxylesterase
MGYRRLSIDGRSVEYLVSGPDDAPDLLLFHGGSPSAAVERPGLTRAATAAGMRVASYSRGGYGNSERREGRSVADEAVMCAALADRLGHESFFTIGWSGGGPVALACAALLPQRVRACLTLASITPLTESGAAWRTLWNPAQLREWDELEEGNLAKLTPDFEAAVGLFSRMTGHRLAAVGGTPDPRALAYGHETQIRPSLVRSMRRAVQRGYFGYLDDNLAQARDWGFRVSSIAVPVVVLHGELDRLVPVAHGRWLAANIPGARFVILPDAGHGSVALPWTNPIAELLAAV